MKEVKEEDLVVGKAYYLASKGGGYATFTGRDKDDDLEFKNEGGGDDWSQSEDGIIPFYSNAGLSFYEKED